MTREQITLIKKEANLKLSVRYTGKYRTNQTLDIWELRRWPNYCFCYHPTISEVLILNITSGKASVIPSFWIVFLLQLEQIKPWDETKSQDPVWRCYSLEWRSGALLLEPVSPFSPRAQLCFGFAFKRSFVQRRQIWVSDFGLVPFFLTTMKKDRKNDRFRLSKAKSVISRLKLDDAVKFISFSIFPVEFIKLHLHFHFSGSDV